MVVLSKFSILIFKKTKKSLYKDTDLSLCTEYLLQLTIVNALGTEMPPHMP